MFSTTAATAMKHLACKPLSFLPAVSPTDALCIRSERSFNAGAGNSISVSMVVPSCLVAICLHLAVSTGVYQPLLLSSR